MSMFTAALFTIAKEWNQPGCPLKDEWINKTWYIYNSTLFSLNKKKEILSFTATRMHPHTKRDQKEKDHHRCHLHVDSKK